MSDLPKCKLCGCASHRMSSNGDIYHKGQGCPLDGVWFSRGQWRTLMAQQQAEPQRVTMAHMDALHKAIDHVAALQNNRLRFQSACEISGDKHPEYVRGYEAAMDAVCRAREQQPTPDVTMKVMEALATILRKAQGRIDTETGECIDIGAECMAIRREFDRISKEDRLLEALERIANMDSMSYHSLESAKITARAALGAAPQAQPAPTNKEHDNAKDAD